MAKKYYLAYGSNMNVEQMSRRCPDATVEGKAILKGYELVFMGRQESAVANILPAEKSVVPVVIWSISSDDEKSLDIYEGYPRLYIKKNVRVKLYGKEISAMAYIMTDGHKYSRGKGRDPQRGTAKRVYFPELLINVSTLRRFAMISAMSSISQAPSVTT